MQFEPHKSLPNRSSCDVSFLEIFFNFEDDRNKSSLPKVVVITANPIHDLRHLLRRTRIKKKSKK